MTDMHNTAVADLTPGYTGPRSTTAHRAAGVSLLVAASVLWSLSGVALKASEMPAVGFALYRSLAAALTMLLLMPLSAGRRPPVRWMLLSVVIYTVVVTFLMAAMKLGTAASGILLQYTSPVFCALFAWGFQRRQIGGRMLMSMSIAVLGIAIMVGGGSGGGGMAAGFLGIISGAAFGAVPLVLARIDQAAGGQANPFQIVLFNNLGAVAILLPVCLFTGQLAAEPWQLGLAGATGAIQLAIPYVLFQLGLRRVSPVEASLLILLEPVLNPVWVALIVGERPDTATICGGAAILIALILEATKPARNTNDA